jgi:mRNA deadenylase 3'-5' endonuclease subunit Ccr4
VEKEKKRIELGLPDPKPEPLDAFDHSFFKRPLLRLPGPKNASEPVAPLTIMTYNVLAQALIQRRIFPASGAFQTSPSNNRRRPKMEEPLENAYQ